MRALGYIPHNAKLVSHEAPRNGILLCPGHLFLLFLLYQVQWNSEVRFQPESMHNLTFMIFSRTSSLLSTSLRRQTMGQYTATWFALRPIRSDARSPLPSCGMNTVFVGFIPLVMIALSPSRDSELPGVYESEVEVSRMGLMVQEYIMMVLVAVVLEGKSMDMIPIRVGMKT